MIDTPETLAVALSTAGPRAVAEARAVVAKSALSVRNEARRNSRISSGVHAAKAPVTITSEPKAIGVSGIGAEIGYEAIGQGRLGHLLEHGNEYGGVRSAPHRDLGRALDVEEPRFEAALLGMASRVL